MDAKYFNIAGSLLIVVSLVISSVSHSMNTRSIVPFILIGVAFFLYCLGWFVESLQLAAKIAETEEVIERLSGNVGIALDLFFERIGFEATEVSDKTWLAKIVDGVKVEVLDIDSTESLPIIYPISEMTSESFGGHTFYYKPGVMGIFFFNGETETFKVYFA